MTTATVPNPTSAETGSPEKTGADIASRLYGPEKDAQADLPENTDKTPEQTPNADSSQTEKPVETPKVEAKTEETPTGTEDEKDPVKKELSEQRKANTRLGREKTELKQQLELLADEVKVLKAKADGTYQDPPKMTEEQERALANFKGREQASRGVADGLYGAEKVQETLYSGKDSPFASLIEKKPWVRAEVAHDPAPTVAAMRAVQREAFLEKYGEDPAQWAAKIEAELRPIILKEFKEQSAKPAIGKTVASVSEARGADAPPKRDRSIADRIYGAPKTG